MKFLWNKAGFANLFSAESFVDITSYRQRRYSLHNKNTGFAALPTLKALPCLCLALSLCLAFSGCSGSDGDSSSALTGNYDLSYSDRDLDSTYDESEATIISLSDEEITIDGDGASAAEEESALYIDSEGTYIVSGTLTDGQIIIEAPDDEKLQLVLDNVDIACSDDAPLLITESDKVFVTLAEGSENVFTGPSTFNSESADAGIDGVIFSKGDLCFNGGGSLTVTAQADNGIVSKDDLIFTGGSYKISAPGDAVQGKDCVKIKDGDFSVSADEDGIKSNNDEDSDRGFISIDGGNLVITAGYDGIQAETLLRLAGGTLDITTGGGSQYGSDDETWGESWGNGGGMPLASPGAQAEPPNGGASPDSQATPPSEGDASGSQANASNEGDSSDSQASSSNEGDSSDSQASSSSTEGSSDTASAKGLKGSLAVVIEGGDITVDSSDDSVHSNGDIAITGGALNMNSGDDGIHADSSLTIDSGDITIEKSYEGLEGNTITVNDGSINLKASDDGLNAAGGNDSSSTDGRAGQNDFKADETAFIQINGGSLTVDASGDGIDSNGSLTVNGGEIYLSGPTDGGNGALDYGGSAEINGGSVILAGSSGMAMNFGNDSSQCSLMYGFSSSQSADSEVSLVDSAGNTLLSYNPTKDYSCVIFSSSQMKTDETYDICVDGEVIESVALSEKVMSYGVNSTGMGNSGDGNIDMDMPKENGNPGNNADDIPGGGQPQ